MTVVGVDTLSVIRAELGPIAGEDENGCFRPFRKPNSRGYCLMKNQQLHRITYELINGPIPEGKELHHTCFNKWCCNPDHLQAVTHAEHGEIHFPGASR